MQRFALYRFAAPALLHASVRPVLISALLLIALFRLVLMLSAPSPTPAYLLPVTPRVSAETHTLPDLFPRTIPADEFALSRMAVDDPQLLNAPLSRLPFSVTGILSSSNPMKSQAILATGTQQFMVGVNDTLNGTSARVVNILGDRLILAYQGRYEALLMLSDTQKKRL